MVGTPSAGDYVLAIDGEDLKGTDDPYRLLRNKADNPVQLTVNKKPSMDGARTISYRPITDEGSLIYLDWINACRRKVSEATGGRVGYIHIPDMGANGIREFIKWYYPQIRKEALIVDVRANGGGNVSRMLIERLRRKLLALNFSRTADEANTYPDAVFIGPMVALLDANSASDGDIFPAMFREAGLGPLIGKRSWGGVVGISNRGQLIDGGGISVPESGFANTKGEWVIEGYGVDPDIEVDNDPKSVLDGKDPQLERGIAEIMARLKQPTRLPAKPAGPVNDQVKTVHDPRNHTKPQTGSFVTETFAPVSRLNETLKEFALNLPPAKSGLASPLNNAMSPGRLAHVPLRSVLRRSSRGSTSHNAHTKARCVCAFVVRS